ncbi:unnamed protein product [Withania somnifera]
MRCGYIEADGSRGILLMWDCRTWVGSCVEVGKFSITYKFEAVQDSFCWFLAGVYAPHSRIEELDCWEEIATVRSLCGGPWVTCGDLNTVRAMIERSGCSRISNVMTDFSNWIEDMEPHDPHLNGGNFTWFRGASHHSAARLDRFLYSMEWEESFRNIRQQIMPKVLSDHSLITLQCGDWERRRSYSKFENWWLNVDGFKELIQGWWSGFENELFEKSLNASFLALIPKKFGVEELKDFGPISLIGGMYKIIAKLITERMKTVMGRLINEHQMAFLKDRRIMDASLLANELVDSKVKKNTPEILCKLDIEKAYDHVNWNFLLKVLSDMGFGGNWIKFSVSGEITGFSAHPNRENDIEITHLLYADESLVFYGAEISRIWHLRAILTIFEGISGLHVNWQKSYLYPVNEVENMQGLASNLVFQVASLPIKYLGMPLGAKNKEMEIWSEVLERSERKLSRWKSQYLSLGGRLTLIRSVMDALQNLYAVINKLRRTFLWQGNKETSGYNLVKWEEVRRSKVQGGLGIKKLGNHNTCLLRRWLWRFCNEDLALWRRFIAQKYGLNNWTTEEVTGTFGCSVWKTVTRMWQDFSAKVDRVAGLLQALNQFSGVSLKPDKLVWKLHNKGLFTVKSCYWDRNTNHSLPIVWPWELIWKVKIPLKVSCFIWLVIRRACLTYEVLQRRYADLFKVLYVWTRRGSKWLPVPALQNSYRSVEHVRMYTKGGLDNASDHFEVLTHWQGVGERRLGKDWWKSIPSCIWWTLWKERNARCFEGKVSNIQKIKMRCLGLLYFWCKPLFI